MDFKQISDKALAVRAKYNELNQKNVGHSWSNRELMEGFVGDVGDLMKFVMAKEGSRHIDDVDEKLKHELADCLWCILVLSKNYGVEIDTEFMEKMDELDERVSAELKAYDQG
jgi:NTP pyrophosphatase (non-canonical NTP hydrolase)